MANITRIKAGNGGKVEEQRVEAVKPEKPVKVAKKPAKKSAKPVKADKKDKKADKKPKNKFLRALGAPFRYIHDSWLELRQVRWPSRGATWKMVLAVLVYTGIFIVILVLLDMFFTFIFELILG